MQTDNTIEEYKPEINSEEVTEIITAVPSWILRSGTTVVLMVLLFIIFLSAFIQYPDVINTELKINSLNAPKSVFVKQTGKIMALLVKEGMMVKQNQPLAFMESTANHRDVIKLHEVLELITAELKNNKIENNLIPPGLNLGELQGNFQIFYEQYLEYISTQDGGYYINKKLYLEKDLAQIEDLKKQLLIQQQTQEKEYANVRQQYEAYKKLYQNKVVSNSEYKDQENRYLSGQYPLQQTATAFLNNNATYIAKEKEVLELDHTVKDQKSKFVQALSSMITQTNAWLNLYVLQAPIPGIASYAGTIQENQTVNVNQELFMINPSNTNFFGEVQILQYNMGKIKIGQSTLVKIRSYPFEQFGLIRGKINYISGVAYKDSVFVIKVSLNKFENKDPSHKIILKEGLRADAEIITEESSLLQRFVRNMTRMLNTRG